jgi:hypothetical protein
MMRPLALLLQLGSPIRAVLHGRSRALAVSWTTYLVSLLRVALNSGHATVQSRGDQRDRQLTSQLYIYTCSELSR